MNALFLLAALLTGVANSWHVGDTALPIDRLRWELDHGLKNGGTPEFGWVVDVEHTWFGPSWAPKQVLFQTRRDPNFQVWVKSDVLWAAGSREWGVICHDYRGLAPGTIVGFGDTSYGRPRRPGIVLTSACTASRFDTFYVIRPLDGLWEANPILVDGQEDVVPWRTRDFV